VGRGRDKNRKEIAGKRWVGENTSGHHGDQKNGGGVGWGFNPARKEVHKTWENTRQRPRLEKNGEKQGKKKQKGRIEGGKS